MEKLIKSKLELDVRELEEEYYYDTKIRRFLRRSK